MYLIVFAILLGLLTVNKKIDKKVSFAVSFVAIGMIIALRFGIGADYFSYEYLYNEFDASNLGNALNSLSFLEVGFRLIMFVGKTLHIPYHPYFVIIELIMLGFALKWMYDNSEHFEWSVLLYYSVFFLVWNLSAIRQGIVLFIGLYFLFNKKFDLSPWKQLAIVVLLATIHVSALIFIPFVILTKLNFTRKQLIIMLVVSLLFTYIPLERIFLPLENIAFIGKFVRYFDNSGRGFLDFPGIVRLLFAGGLLFFYDMLVKHDEYTRKITNLSILSFILYFFLKFSELAASRLSIAGYFAIVLIFPIILDYLKQQKLIGFIGKIALVAFCSVSMYKEINTAIRQSSYNGSFKTVNTETIFNFDRYNYYDQYNLIAQKNKVHDTNYKEFQDRLYAGDITEMANTNDEVGYAAVYFENVGLYGIINNRGEIVEKPKFSYRPELVGNIVVENSEDTAFKRNLYRYIGTETYLNDDEIVPVLSKNAADELFLRSHWITFDHYTYLGLHNLELGKLLREEDVFASSIGKYGSPFYYEVIEVSAFSQTMYVFLDQYYEQMNTSIYVNFDPFNTQGIAKGYSQKTVEYINQEGTIIWIERIN